ncbi:MAG: peptidase M42 [Acidimicrobiia bacterium]|nr:peptidase M42 [Acidimicrobiia bacterium]
MTVIDAGRVSARVQRYLRVPSVVGFEQPFLAVLEADLHALGRSSERRPGLLAAPGGPVTVSAHVDRHGFVTGPGGALAYAANEVSHRALSPRLAAVVCTRYDQEDVVAYDTETGRILGRATIVHGGHCGIGPELDLEAPELAHLPASTPVAFTPPPQEEPGALVGQLDNTLSAAMAVELLASGFDGTVLFTCGEEAGRSWLALASWFDRPSTRLFVLDTSPFDDAGPVERGTAVLRHADAGAEFDSSTTGQLADAAQRVGVDILWKDDILSRAGRPLGRTELGRVISETAGRVSGSTLQIPTTDYHTNRERTSWTAIEAVGRVLVAATLV